jgi:hypothetical protein
MMVLKVSVLLVLLCLGLAIGLTWQMAGLIAAYFAFVK